MLSKNHQQKSEKVRYRLEKIFSKDISNKGLDSVYDDLHEMPVVAGMVGDGRIYDKGQN